MSLTKLRLEITNNCPYACGFCSVSAGPARSGYMPTGSAVGLIGQFANINGEEITFTGGEPLEHPGLTAMLHAARSHQLITTVFSMGVRDGQPLTNEDVGELAELVDRWRVSLHGSEPRVHDRITNSPGSFTATLTAAQRLVAAGVRVCASYVASDSNIDDLARVQDLCRQIGITELRMLAVVPQGRASHQGVSYVAGDRLNDAVKSVRRAPGSLLRVGEAARVTIDGDSDCKAFQDELIVNWEGWVSRCHAIEPASTDSTLDNVFRTPLIHLLEHSPLLAACRAEASRRAKNGCASGCIARAAVRPRAVVLQEIQDSLHKLGGSTVGRVPH